MGKMKLNKDEFDIIEGDVVDIVPTKKNQIDIVDAQTSFPNQCAYRNNSNGNHTIQVKYDMISNIVGDVCGVLQEMTRTIGAINIEREKTKQVEAISRTKIREAIEQTERVRIQESQETERMKMTLITEIRKAEIELREELEHISVEKEAIFSDERKYDRALKPIVDIVNDIIDQNRKYMSSIDNFDKVHENNEQLIRLSEQIVSLYIKQ